MMICFEMGFQPLLVLLSLLFEIAVSQQIVIPTDKSYCEESTRDFLDIVRSPWYVDKTKMIEEFMNSWRQSIDLTMPPGFGKSINLSMLKYFFDITLNEADGFSVVADKKNTPAYKLFTDPTLNLSISRNQEFIDQYLGEYIVIHFSLKHLYGKTEEEGIINLFRILHEQFGKKYSKWFDHRRDYIYKNSNFQAKSIEKIFKGINVEINYINSTSLLRYMVECLREFYKKEVILLVDDTDRPAINAMLMDVDPYPISNHINSLLFEAIKYYTDASSILGALLTGTFSSIRNTLKPGSRVLYNMDVYSFLRNDPTVEYFGFLPHEVEGLFEKHNLLGDKVNQTVISYYYGFEVEESPIKLFNPVSIIRCLKECLKGTVPFFPIHLHPMIANVSRVIGAAMNYPELRSDMFDLWQGRSSKPYNSHHHNIVLHYENLLRAITHGRSKFNSFKFQDDKFLLINYLFHNGYLTCAEQRFKIANYAALHTIRNAICNFYKAKKVNFHLVATPIYNVFTNDPEMFLEGIENNTAIFQQVFRNFTSKIEPLNLKMKAKEFYWLMYTCLDIAIFANMTSERFRVFSNATTFVDSGMLGLVDENRMSGLIIICKSRENGGVRAALREAKKITFDGMNDLKYRCYMGIDIDSKLNVKVGFNYTKSFIE